MDWLNYHHLYYFWVIAREGSITKAAAELHVTHSTLSVQLRSIEDFLGGKLFDRRGRSLSLTPFGSDVAAFANEIFRTGNELVEMARGRSPSRKATLRAGVAGAIPKTVGYRLLEPALDATGFGPITVRQDNFEQLMSDLVSNRVHVVISDVPPPEGMSVRVYGHLLGETDVLLYGTSALAERYRKGFPRSLEDAPMLLPSRGTSLRALLERWFAQNDLRIRLEGEFDDAGMMRTFGLAGRGLLPVRAALRTEVEEAPDMKRIGRFDGIRERYYAISVERRVKHPAMVAIVEGAREKLNEPLKRSPARPRRARASAGGAADDDPSRTRT